MDIILTDRKQGSIATWTVDSVERTDNNAILRVCTNGKHLEISGQLVSKIATIAWEPVGR